MKKWLVIFKVICAILLLQVKVFAQVTNTDSVRLDRSRLYSVALDANIQAALQLVNVDSNSLSQPDKKLKFRFEQRFKYDTDKTVYPAVSSPVNDLVQLYKQYWRVSLLNPDSNYDERLGRSLTEYLASHYPPAKFITTLTNRDTIGTYLSHFLKEYIESFHLHTTGFGKTGKLLDLLIWKNQNDTAYNFKLNKEQITVPVAMMDDFVTLGWEEYATMEKYYPGGWATDQSLFCVKKAYDLSSESFLISYLAHEGRHFADYKLFPALKSEDLEYRAKLVELSLAQKTLYSLIGFFIDNANLNSKNGHSIANYRVIKDLSMSIFKTEFEKDKDRWRKTDPKKINKAASKLLQSNTKAIQKMPTK